FEFVLPQTLVGTEQKSGDAQFSLDVTLADTAGQKQSKRLMRTVTANPIHIEVIPESQSLVQGQSNVLYLYTSYPDGRPALTRVVTGATHETVFIEPPKDGQTMLMEMIDLTKGTGTYEFDLPPDLFGTLELCAYRYDASGVAVRKSRALYVRPVRDLDIKATL